MKRETHDPMAAQREAEEYNRNLPRLKKITLGDLPVGTKSTDGEWPKREVRKGRTADPDDTMNSRQPMVFGLEMGGLAPGPIRTPKEYKQPEAGPDPDYLSPKGYKRQPHQRPGRIVSDDLKPEMD